MQDKRVKFFTGESFSAMENELNDFLRGRNVESIEREVLSNGECMITVTYLVISDHVYIMPE